MVERVQHAVPPPRTPRSLRKQVMHNVQTRQAHRHDRERSPAAAADCMERVRLNQQRLTSDLQPHYDFIVCGSGSSGSAVARRLAENRDASVLLLEAGGGDEVPSVM